MLAGLRLPYDKAEHGPSSHTILNQDTGLTRDDGHFMHNDVVYSIVRYK